MKVAIASGKGGTGKTLLASCLTRVLAGADLLVIDADVEEPNMALIVANSPQKAEPVYRKVPGIIAEQCNLCGKCAEVCLFNALITLNDRVMVFNELCHSCGACSYICPEKAIAEINHQIGLIEHSSLENGGKLLTGRLVIGEAQSPPLIKVLKEAEKDRVITIVDCPPGTTCPMVEAIRDCDYCLLVTEATPLGLHDLKISIKACHLLGIPGGLVINRWRGSDGGIKELAQKNGMPLLGRIPFNAELAQVYARGEDPIKAFPELKNIVENIFSGVKEILS